MCQNCKHCTFGRPLEEGRGFCLYWGFNIFLEDVCHHYVPLPDETRCRVCGCTWDNACPGGCYWEEVDLCSRCAGIDHM